MLIYCFDKSLYREDARKLLERAENIALDAEEHAAGNVANVIYLSMLSTSN